MHGMRKQSKIIIIIIIIRSILVGALCAVVHNKNGWVRSAVLTALRRVAMRGDMVVVSALEAILPLPGQSRILRREALALLEEFGPPGYALPFPYPA